MDEFDEGNVAAEGLADFALNISLIFMFLLFFFMVNAGVRASDTGDVMDLVDSLMQSQEEALAEAAAAVSSMSSEIEDSEKKSRKIREEQLEQIESAQKELGDGEKRERNLTQEIKTLQHEIRRIASMSRTAQSLRIVMCHDETGSMAEAITDSKRGNSSLCRTLPVILKEVEVGVVGYRDKKLNKFPLVAVKKPSEDGGVSVRDLATFYDKMAAVGGTANTAQAVETAMSWFDAETGSPREVLILIGDVFTSEITKGQAAADALVAKVRRWSEEPGKDRRVLAIYTGSKGGAEQKHFEQLANVNELSKFSTDTGQLFELIMQAAFAPKEEQKP